MSLVLKFLTVRKKLLQPIFLSPYFKPIDRDSYDSRFFSYMGDIDASKKAFFLMRVNSLLSLIL